MGIIKPDLSVSIGKLKLKNPIIGASGTYGYADEYEDFVDLQNIGAIVTKGITLQPREGNPQPRIKEVKNGLINSIGLENIGIDAFIETKLPVLKEKNIEFIINVAGFSISEYEEVSRICEVNGIKAIELNVSCPNVKEGCLEFGRDKELLNRLISSVREVFSGTLITKLSSNVSSPVDFAVVAERSGADAISAINTVKAMNVNSGFKDGKLEYRYIKGGLSGSAIKPMALNFIYEIKDSVNIPIIGMGGISSMQDFIDFISVGASAIQIGTANFTNPAILNTMVKDLEACLSQNHIESYVELIKGEEYAYS